MIKPVIFFFLLSFAATGHARSLQYPQQPEVKTIQPRIMVIPYTKEGEDIRTVLEGDINKRIALSKIKEAFDKRGFTTVDFTSRLKTAMGNAVFSGANKSDVKAQIIQMSGADVYVEAEIDLSKNAYSAKKAKVLLQAYEATSGNSLANIIGESKLISDDMGLLVSKAVEGSIEEFLNTMQTKFTDIVNDGKTILVTIGFDANSEYDLSSPIGTDGLPLSDVIEIWMSENAYKNYYHLQGVSDTEMLFDDIRIPLRDPVTNANYTLNRFALSFYQYLRTLGLNVRRDVKGNTLFVTIQ